MRGALVFAFFCQTSATLKTSAPFSNRLFAKVEIISLTRRSERELAADV